MPNARGRIKPRNCLSLAPPVQPFKLPQNVSFHWCVSWFRSLGCVDEDVVWGFTLNKVGVFPKPWAGSGLCPSPHSPFCWLSKMFGVCWRNALPCTWKIWSALSLHCLSLPSFLPLVILWCRELSPGPCRQPRNVHHRVISSALEEHLFPMQ